jgi:hypothetical protein
MKSQKSEWFAFFNMSSKTHQALFDFEFLADCWSEARPA